MGLLEKADSSKEKITSSDTSHNQEGLRSEKKKKSLLTKAENFIREGSKFISDKGLLKKAEKIHYREGYSDKKIESEKNLSAEEKEPNISNFHPDAKETEPFKSGSTDSDKGELSTDESNESQDETKAPTYRDDFLEDIQIEPALGEVDSDHTLSEKNSKVAEISETQNKILSEDEKLEDLENIVPDELFRDWEKDAAYDASKTPFRPKTEDPIDEKKDYLFDDDSDFTTVPSEIHIASKKKIENYLALFELTKEISRSDSYDEFFEGLTYSLTGQIGCDSIAVFSSKHTDFDVLRLVESHGLEINPDWTVSKGDELYSIFINESSVRYATDLLQKIPSQEVELMRDTHAEIITPIRNGEKFFGIILVGKNIAGEDYTADDLEFLKIAGEISGSFFERIQEAEKKNHLISHLNEVIKSNEIIISLSRILAEVRDFDGALDEIMNTFSKDLGVLRYSFFVYDRLGETGYKAFSSNILTPESMLKLHFKNDSEIVGVVSNIPGVYNIAEFRQIRELRQQLANDDLGFLREFIVIPFINLNWLVGFLVVHEISFPWTDSNREVAVGISEVAAPVLANVMMLKEKETVFRDPFNPIEERIDQEIENCEKLSIPFCLTIFKIQNTPRIINLLGQDFFVTFSDFLRNKIHENLSEADFLVKVGRGKFAVLFHGKETEEAGIVIKKIKLKIEEFNQSVKDFKLSISTHSLTYPKDTKEKAGFLEIIDES